MWRPEPFTGESLAEIGRGGERNAGWRGGAGPGYEGGGGLGETLGGGADREGAEPPGGLGADAGPVVAVGGQGGVDQLAQGRVVPGHDGQAARDLDPEALGLALAGDGHHVVVVQDRGGRGGPQAQQFPGGPGPGGPGVVSLGDGDLDPGFGGPGRPGGGPGPGGAGA